MLTTSLKARSKMEYTPLLLKDFIFTTLKHDDTLDEDVSDEEKVVICSNPRKRRPRRSASSASGDLQTASTNLQTQNDAAPPATVDPEDPAALAAAKAASAEATRLRKNREKKQQRRNVAAASGHPAGRRLQFVETGSPVELDSFRTVLLSHSTTGYTGTHDGTEEYRFQGGTASEELAEFFGMGYKEIDPTTMA